MSEEKGWLHVLLFSFSVMLDKYVCTCTGVLVKEEEKEVGAVAIHVYKSYWLAVGNRLATSIIIALFLMQGMRFT